MTDWFTGDTHFSHANIIQYCSRPFKDISEMDSVIINNLNDLVLPDDRLFHLGDVAFKGAAGTLPKLRARINCKNIFVVPGNHDREKELRRYFTTLPQCYIYRDGDYRIVLSHYAMRVWSSSHHGTTHLFGHSHGKLPIIPETAAFDIGVDCWNFKPLNLNQVKAEMKRLCPLGKTFVGDHHGAKQLCHK